MATYSVASAAHKTLVAATVDTVNLSSDRPWVKVVNRTGSAEITFTTDGTTPTAAADNTYVLPAAIGASLVVPSEGVDQVKLISAGTPAYSVMTVQTRD